jgi:signal transduction histidine kinase
MMGQLSQAEADASVAPYYLDIATTDAPIALCTTSGLLQAATGSARSLLRRLSRIEHLPATLPSELWSLLEGSAPGEAVEWRSLAEPHEVLGCTRYLAAPGAYVLLMREMSAKRLLLSDLLHRQRLETTGHLVAGIARDIRSSVASMVYSAEFLNASGRSAPPEVLSETMGDISRASASLQGTLDALLDYAHLGPAVSLPVQLRDVLNRAMASLRGQYGERSHRIRVDLAPRAELVRGNPIVIEQLFVSLLRNAVEAAAAPRCVIVTAFPMAAPPSLSRGVTSGVCIRVWDDGPGIPADHRRFVFEPFFTTKPGSLGLGLAMARQAAESLDGQLELTDDETGTCFSLYLPCAEEIP